MQRAQIELSLRGLNRNREKLPRSFIRHFKLLSRILPTYSPPNPFALRRDERKDDENRSLERRYRAEENRLEISLFLPLPPSPSPSARLKGSTNVLPPTRQISHSPAILRRQKFHRESNRINLAAVCPARVY